VSDERLWLCYPICGRQTQESLARSDAERSPTKLVNRSSRSYPSTARAEANGVTIAPSSTASSGSYAPALPGATSRRGTVPGRPAIERLHSLEARRYLRSSSGPRPDQELHGWGTRVEGERGRHSDLCSPEHAASASQASQASRTKKGAPKSHRDGALVRCRGGFPPKIHPACDGKGRPLSVVLGSVQVSAVAAPSLRNCLTQCGCHVLSTHPVDRTNALRI
jgi:hypothetical protein